MAAPSLRILSYNILHPELAVKWKQPEGAIERDGTWHSNWESRRHELAANIAAAKADIVLLQELGPGFVPDLPPHLALSQLCLHSPTRQGIYYGNAIAYDAARFNPSPYRLSTDPSRERASCAAGLWDRKEQKYYFALSAHLAGYGPEAEDALEKAHEGDKELEGQLWHLDEYTGQQLCILGGDFNMDPLQHRNRADLMAKFKYLTAPGRVASEPATGREIDFIYVLGVRPEQLSEPTIAWPYPKASDHLPRVLDINFAP